MPILDSRVKFTFSSPTDEFGYYSKLAEYAGADLLNIPTIMLLDASKGHLKYKFPGAITAENIHVLTGMNCRNSSENSLKINWSPTSNPRIFQSPLMNQ